MEPAEYEWQPRPDGTPIKGSKLQTSGGNNEINTLPVERTEEDIKVGVIVGLVTRAGESRDVTVEGIGVECRGTVAEEPERPTKFLKAHVHEIYG